MNELNLSLSMNLKLTEDQKSQSGIDFVDGPVHTDSCDHGREFYVCSIEEFTRPHTTDELKLAGLKISSLTKVYDLYVFPNGRCGQEVCIRYGSEGSEYISPGSIADFLHQSNAPYHYHKRDIYHLAAAVLRSFGRCEWSPRT